MSILILVIIFLLNVTGAYAQLNSGIIAHWDFSGNANDITGKNHNGIPSNITYVSSKTGAPNAAALFNGFNSRIAVAHQADLNMINYSICAKVYVGGYYTGNCETTSILSRGADHKQGSYSMIFSDNPFDGGKCGMLDTSKYVFMGGAGTNFLLPGQHAAVQYTPPIVSGNWYCVVVSNNGSKLNTYVNSALVSSISAPNAVGSSAEGLTIGASHNTSFTSHPYWLNGIIDDLRIYDRALSDNDIKDYCALFSGVGPAPKKVMIAEPVEKTIFCAGENFQLKYSVTNPFNPGNIFTAELSDAAGSFNTPINIGSIGATTAGIINCTIPVNIPQGKAYRVRITATSPADVSADNGVNLTVLHVPGLALLGKTDVCKGDTISIIANVTPDVPVYWTGPGGFTGNTKQITISNATIHHSGKYTVTTQNNGCDASKTINVTVNEVELNLGNDTLICEGEKLVLRAGAGNASYRWQNSTIADTLLVTRGGVYTVTATSGKCEKKDTIIVHDMSQQLNMGNDTTMCNGAKLTLAYPAWANSKFTWQDGSSQPTFTISSAGSYNITATNRCGIFSDGIKVIYQECDCKPFIPTAFSPNKDGLNDGIKPIFNCTPRLYNFIIANRWGEIVFRTNNINERWYGLYKASICDIGTYYYLIEITDPLNNKNIFKGDFILIR